MSEFVIACMELPPCEKSSKVDKAFQTFREEATKLVPPELSKSLLVALDVASSEEARENALRDSDDEDGKEELNLDDYFYRQSFSRRSSSS